MTSSGLLARIGTSKREDALGAVEDLVAQVAQPDPSVVLVFCSPSYDLAVLGPALRAAFPCPVIGCSSAGQLGPNGFQKGGITAVSLASPNLRVTSYLISPVTNSESRAADVAFAVRADRARRPDALPAFGLILVDGLAMQEERLTAALYRSLGAMPIFGGSAGDDLAFEKTLVLHDGVFIESAATFTVFETSHPFETFRFQHFVPTGVQLVTTASDPARRIVSELDGLPAAEAYAAAIGIPQDALDAHAFSKHPVMVRVGDDYYVRSIYRANPDGSLTFLCAIEEGVVLTLGTATDPVETVRTALDGVASRLGPPAVVLGCDCILRRLELEHDALDDEIGRLFSERRVVGFSTYGEQFNSVHVNQTFTGVMIGAATR